MQVQKSYNFSFTKYLPNKKNLIWLFELAGNTVKSVFEITKKRQYMVSTFILLKFYFYIKTYVSTII